MDTEAAYREKYTNLLPQLTERAKRLMVASDAKMLGYGGIAKIHRASGLSRATISSGIKEVKQKVTLPPHRSRKKGGGRKSLVETDPTVTTDLACLVEDSTRGDPMIPLRWISKSTRHLAKELRKSNHSISHRTVGKLLKADDYTLQSNVKSKEGMAFADRNKQFQYISDRAKEYLKQGDPVISVDTKKKELVGEYKNNGREWLPKGKPRRVNSHDFPDKELGKAIPYGVYDIRENNGYVTVGITHDTSEFAVSGIRNWWEHLGKKQYQGKKKILITPDAGGSNGYRVRLWKRSLQEFSDDTGLEITVCHFPRGTSKWNKIEHKLFSYISMNWKGQPLVSLEVIISLIAATTTNTGLKVYASVDTKEYKTKKKVSDREMKKLHLYPHEFHPELNYTIKPTSPLPT